MNRTKSILSSLGLLAGTAAFIAAFALNGCVADSKGAANHLNGSDLSVSQTDGPDGEPSFNIHEETEWECQINPQLPVYRLVLARDRSEESSMCPNTLYIYDKQSGELMQTLAFEAVANENELPPVKMADVDFDGYLDLIIHAGQGAGSIGYYEAYCWQANGTTDFQGYVARPSLDYLDSDYQPTVFNDTHQLMTCTYRELSTPNTSLYQVERADKYSRPEFRLLRYCDFDWETDETFRVMEITDTDTKCIYEFPCRSGKMTDRQKQLVQNYLRFGVPDPITTEQALHIAGKKYPGAEWKFMQMLTFGGRSYFHFSWNSGDKSGDCGVATDGSEVIDCGGYLSELQARAVPAFNATGDTV